MIDLSIAVSTPTIPLTFDESDPSAMLMASLILERYEGIEQPLMKFSREGVTTLIVPRTIRRVFNGSKTIQADRIRPTEEL